MLKNLIITCLLLSERQQLRTLIEDAYFGLALLREKVQ